MWKICCFGKVSHLKRLKFYLKKNIHKPIWKLWQKNFIKNTSKNFFYFKKIFTLKIISLMKTIFPLKNQRKLSLAPVEPFEFPINQIESIEARPNNIYFQRAINFPLLLLAGKKNSSKCFRPIFMPFCFTWCFTFSNYIFNPFSFLF